MLKNDDWWLISDAGGKFYIIIRRNFTAVSIVPEQSPPRSIVCVLYSDVLISLKFIPLHTSSYGDVLISLNFSPLHMSRVRLSLMTLS